MFKYTLKRGVISLITVWIVITITFFLMRAIPGDPFTDEKKIPPEIMANLEAKHGLDKPLITQYGIYLKNLTQGELGDSMKYKSTSVTSILKTGLPVSAKLGLVSTIIGASLGIIAGIIAALNRGKKFDFFIIILAVIGVAVPNFVFAALFQYGFGSKLGWLPVARWGTPAHYVLPVLSLAIGMIGYIARMMRTSMLDVLNQDYVKTAKAKGLSKTAVVMKHTIRNAILPIITILGALVASIVVGAFVIETIYAIPGIGEYYVQSIQESDYTLILGITVFYASILVFIMFLIDIIYGLVDPRIRLDRDN